MEEETWNVINSYFEKNKTWMASHQINSYNDFVNNKIPSIFKGNNLSSVYIYDKEDKSITYQLDFYVCGEKANKYKICLPSIYNHEKGEMKPMIPNEARLKNLTYGFDMFIDLEVKVSMKKGNEYVYQNRKLEKDDFLKNIYLGNIPIMLRSDMCVLNKVDPSAYPEFGESKYEFGGYFIIDGREKMIICQERKAENILFLEKINDNKIDKIVEVKSKSDEAFTHARTIKLQLEHSGCITVRLGQQKAFIREYEGRDIPLFIMFRFLGVETDKEILELICGDLDTELSNKLVDLLRPSIMDPVIKKFNVYDKQMAENYLEPLTSRSQTDITGNKLKEIQKNKLERLSFLYDSVAEALLPQVGRDFVHKRYYLAYMTKKLLLFELGLEKVTKRDNFMNKRIDVTGFMLSTLFKDALNQTLYNAKREIKRKYEFNSKELSGANFINIINENNYYTVFDNTVFKKEFIDSLKKGNIGNKIGVVQQLDRINYYSTLSHIRRITDPVSGNNVVDDRRRLNVTQFGYICPLETPEGGNVGLRKALSLLATITIGYPTHQLKEYCFKYGVIPLKNMNVIDSHNYCKVFINGNWIGCIHNSYKFVKLFKLMRRNGLINLYTSISHYPLKNEIFIYCDDGRLVRPMYIIENNELLIQDKDIKEIKDGKKTFFDLCKSTLKFKSNSDKLYVNNPIFIKNVSTLNLSEDDPELEYKLQLNQAKIEYLDVQEFDTSMTSINLEISLQDKTSYTHVDLHPSLYLGVCAHLLPHVHHQQGPRAIYASKHIKQGVGTYTSNFLNRIDTSAHILHNPEVPMIHTRLNEVLHNHKMVTGQNIIVAIAYYNGYNQEDGILANKTSIDMGLFGSSYYKMYEAFEKTDTKSGTEERFYNPLYKDEISEYPESLDPKTEYTFDKLDKFGFIKEGTYLDGKENVIGKYFKSKDEHGEEQFKDMSSHTKKDNKGSYVDKVFTCQTNAVGDRLCKIRTCQYRKPEIGDKFASRCAQKGTYGVMLPREDLPSTSDGLVPDIIIHPSGYPKRMTINQLLELLYGNLAVECGFFGLASPLESFPVKEVNNILTDKLGFSYYGDRILYNGVYGEQMDTAIFMGPMYYQRLKYMVHDKINVRASGHREDGIPVPGGAYTARERQVVSGRANGGGLRVGEMERDALISHGVFGFIRERDIVRSDKFIVFISPKNGEITIGNPNDNIFYDILEDGPISHHLLQGTEESKQEIIGLNISEKRQQKFIKVEIPYAMKLLIHEMNGMGMFLRMKTESLKLIQNMRDRNENIDDLIVSMEDIINEEENEISELLQKSLISDLEETLDKDKPQFEAQVGNINTNNTDNADNTDNTDNTSNTNLDTNNFNPNTTFKSEKEVRHPSDLRMIANMSNTKPMLSDGFGGNPNNVYVELEKDPGIMGNEQFGGGSDSNDGSNDSDDGSDTNNNTNENLENYENKNTLDDSLNFLNLDNHQTGGNIGNNEQLGSNVQNNVNSFTKQINTNSNLDSSVQTGGTSITDLMKQSGVNIENYKYNKLEDDLEDDYDEDTEIINQYGGFGNNMNSMNNINNMNSMNNNNFKDNSFSLSNINNRNNNSNNFNNSNSGEVKVVNVEGPEKIINTL